VFTRVAKPVIGDEKRFFHRLIAANFSADINHRQVLKLAPNTHDFVVSVKVSGKIFR